MSVVRTRVWIGLLCLFSVGLVVAALAILPGKGCIGTAQRCPSASGQRRGGASPPPMAATFPRLGIAASWMRDEQITAVVDGIASTGARAVRFDVPWSSIERVRGNPVWTHIDRIVAAFANRGIAMLGICTYAPTWANGGQPNTFPPLTAYYQEFATFCAAAARRYPQIRAWEVWNEPNLDQFWHDPNARDYSALLSSTYRAVKQVDPHLTVVSGGLAPHGAYGRVDDGGVNPRTFLEEMYAAGARGSMDAVGDHPYGTPATASFRELGDTRPSVRSIMVRNGDGSKAIWPTEVGQGLQPYEVSGAAATEAEQ